MVTVVSFSICCRPKSVGVVITSNPFCKSFRRSIESLPMVLWKRFPVFYYVVGDLALDRVVIPPTLIVETLVFGPCTSVGVTPPL